MGVTAVSKTVRSATVANDGEDLNAASSVPDSVAFASLGTGPVLDSIKASDGGCRITFTSGTGVPLIAANNVQFTMGRPPRAVYLRNRESAPGFHVASIAAAVINIGTKVAPAISTQFVLDVIVLY